jgi:ribose 5-phosphate isomerase
MHTPTAKTKQMRNTFKARKGFISHSPEFYIDIYFRNLQNNSSFCKECNGISGFVCN